MLLIIDTITWKPHLETAMEVALQRRESGEQVVFCSLRKGLPACEDASSLHRLIDLPETRVGRALEILKRHGVSAFRPGYSRGELSFAKLRARELLNGCKTTEDLKQLSHDGYHDIGWGMISSVVSITKNSMVELATHRRTFLKYCESAILVYEKVRRLIDEFKPTELLLFNGRFATTRAAMRAAQSKGVAWKIHERGGSRERYWVSDCMPHDMDRIQDKIRDLWKDELASAGHAFFQARRHRVERGWHSFTEGQEYGRLPPEMAGNAEWITFFTSSEDEMFSIGDSFSSKLFPNQLDAIRTVAACVGTMDGTRLCVRVHPHVAGKSLADQHKWAHLELPGVLVIGPEDQTDSYALIDRSKVVCSYGSTVGIEATYWGRPSLLFFRSFYEALGVCEHAQSTEQVLSFLRNPAVYPQERTLPYGAFWELLGEPYRYYKAESLHRGQICGTYLDDGKAVLAARWLQKQARVLSGSAHQT